MMMTKKFSVLLLFAVLLMALLSGCGQLDTVESFVVASTPYDQNAAIENAAQPEKVSVNKAVYASVYFIESPKGMEYTAKWYLDDTVIKIDTQKTTTNMAGVIVYTLEADKVAAGTLKFEITYGDDILCSKELAVE